MATAVDLLGNESEASVGRETLSDDDALGQRVLDTAVTLWRVTEGVKKTTVPAVPAGLRGGVDTQEPTIEFTTASPKDECLCADESSRCRWRTQAGLTGKSWSPPDEVLATVVVRDAKGAMICGDHAMI